MQQGNIADEWDFWYVKDECVYIMQNTFNVVIRILQFIFSLSLFRFLLSSPLSNVLPNHLFDLLKPQNLLVKTRKQIFEKNHIYWDIKLLIYLKKSMQIIKTLHKINWKRFTYHSNEGTVNVVINILWAFVCSDICIMWYYALCIGGTFVS